MSDEENKERKTVKKAVKLFTLNEVFSILNGFLDEGDKFYLRRHFSVDEKKKPLEWIKEINNKIQKVLKWPE